MSSGVIERLNAALDGRYRVEREIGRGGMAVVYLAQDLKHGRPVAIKVLNTEVAEVVGEERFAREIETAARLNHPNILALHDSGEADGLRYFVMPFVDGESLRDVLEREGPLELDRVLTHAREIGGALAYAHEQGLVHRDIKPENILFQAGQAVVCDFGIAKAMTEASVDTLTRTGTSVGTFAYMSPEQLSDELVVDTRSDLYSLGCVIHEMLEGSPPFQAASPRAALAKKLIGELPERSSRPVVPDSVWGVVQRSVASDVDRRYSTAEEMIDALSSATTAHAVARSRRRRRLGTAGRSLAWMTLAGALVGVGMWLSDRVGGPTYDRLAVLPLANGANDPREDFYVRGVHEDLVAEMQRAGLRVVNPSATRRFTDDGTPISEIAESLEVDAVVEGSVERVGPRIVIDVRLSDAVTEDVVWTQSYSGAQTDVIELLRRITLALAEQTGAQLDPEVIAAFQAAAEIDAVLYELLLEGRYEAFKLTREGLDLAESFYERAVRRDSMSGEAWRGLAQIWSLRAQQGLVPADVARDLRDSIVHLAPVGGIDGRDRALRYTWFDWPQARWGDAEAAFVSELEAQPSDARTRAYYAQFLMYQGREDQAEREGLRAARQAPDDALVLNLVGQMLTWLYRYDEAKELFERALALSPGDPYALAMLRTMHHLEGEDSAAIERWRTSYAREGEEDLEALDSLEAGYDRGGYGSALSAVAELFVDRHGRGWDPDGNGIVNVSVWQIGTLFTRAGRTDEALHYLALALDEGDTNSLSIAVDPIFDPMRDDPRFQALVDRLRLPARQE